MSEPQSILQHIQRYIDNPMPLASDRAESALENIDLEELIDKTLHDYKMKSSQIMPENAEWFMAGFLTMYSLTGGMVQYHAAYRLVESGEADLELERYSLAFNAFMRWAAVNLDLYPTK